MSTEEIYKKARQSHNNKFKNADSLANPASESLYRESAQKLKDAYAAYASEIRKKGTPMPIWF